MNLYQRDQPSSAGDLLPLEIHPIFPVLCSHHRFHRAQIARAGLYSSSCDRHRRLRYSLRILGGYRAVEEIAVVGDYVCGEPRLLEGFVGFSRCHVRLAVRVLLFGRSLRIGGWQHHLNLVEGTICGGASEDMNFMKLGNGELKRDYCTHSGNKGGLEFMAGASV